MMAPYDGKNSGSSKKGTADKKKNSSNTNPATNDVSKVKRKPRILFLHGKYQSGSTFSNKIAGARRKLSRSYDLHFLDGPIRLLNDDGDDDEGEPQGSEQDKEGGSDLFAWWNKNVDTGEHTLVEEGMTYVLRHMQEQEENPYIAVVGFSQGGVLATALCCSGLVPSIRAVLTAGAPMVDEAFAVADRMAAAASAAAETSSITNRHDDKSTGNNGYQIPKLHLAGETDSMIPVESTRALCDRGGNGRLIVHDQGHLFPTRSARVQEMLDFLDEALA